MKKQNAVPYVPSKFVIVLRALFIVAGIALIVIGMRTLNVSMIVVGACIALVQALFAPVGKLLTRSKRQKEYEEKLAETLKK